MPTSSSSLPLEAATREPCPSRCRLVSGFALGAARARGLAVAAESSSSSSSSSEGASMLLCACSRCALACVHSYQVKACSRSTASDFGAAVSIAGT